MAVSLPGSQVTLRWCLMGQGMMQAESCCLLLPPTGSEEEELGSFPCGNSQLLCLLGLEPPSGAQHPAWGTSCIPYGSPHPWGLSAGFGVPCQGLGAALRCLSAWELWGTRCPHPAPVAASREMKYPRRRECSCFNESAVVRTWCGGN